MDDLVQVAVLVLIVVAGRRATPSSKGMTRDFLSVRF